MSTDQLIQAYIQNKLSADERKAFELTLDKDKELQNSLNEHKAILEAFKVNEAKRLKNRLKDHEDQISNTKSSKPNPIFFAIAATVLVLIGASVYFNLYQQNLYDQYFESYPNVYQPIVRGNSEQSTEAFVYYENDDFKNAQKAFENYLEKNNNPNIRFYLALSYLNDNQPLQALTEFEKLENIEFEFQAEVYWYSSLANLKLEKKSDAIKLLDILNSKFPEYMPADVEQLIGELN